MKKIFLIILLLTSAIAGANDLKTYTSVLAIGPSYRINPSGTMVQYETDICRHPVNQSFIFATASTINSLTSFRSEGIYLSSNGGLNWFNRDTMFGSPVQNHGSDPGPAVDNNGRLLFIHHGSFITGIFSHYSTDFGSNWSSAYLISSGDMDKGNDIYFDASPSSPYFGRFYASYIFLTPPFKVFFSYTSNGGENWSTSTSINNPPQRCQGAEIRTNLNGDVFVSWGSVINTSPFTEDYIGFAKSTNGGNNWSVNETAANINGVAGRIVQKGNIAINGLPRMDIDNTGGVRNGWIYIITTEKNLSPAGSDPDVILRKSTDGGQTFTPAVRVNQDALNNGKTQFFPVIRVDEEGGVNIVYYDDRNTANDSTEVYLSRSTDGGNTFADYVVSDHRFAPKSIVGAGAGNMGDKIGLTSGNGKLYAVWMSDKSGIFQAWMTPIDLSSVGIKKISGITPSGFSLEQNYPNPFNQSSIIKFQSPVEGLTQLKIYDILGKEVSTLLNENLLPGTYELRFDAKDLPSGIYFYKLTTGNFTDTKRMIFLK